MKLNWEKLKPYVYGFGTVIALVLFAGIVYVASGGRFEFRGELEDNSTEQPNENNTSDNTDDEDASEEINDDDATASDGEYQSFTSVTIHDLSFPLIEGWSYQEVQDGVKLTKGNYAMYILYTTDGSYLQASGVLGGRFSEITQYMPASNLVINIQPSGECGVIQTDNLMNNVVRKDLFASSVGTGECNASTDGVNHWYGSFISVDGAYVNDLAGFSTGSADCNGQLIVTMSYEGATNINMLPTQPEFNEGWELVDMTTVVNSLSFMCQN